MAKSRMKFYIIQHNQGGEILSLLLSSIGQKEITGPVYTQGDRIIQEHRHQEKEALGTTIKPVCQVSIIIKPSIRETLILNFEREFKITLEKKTCLVTEENVK